MEMKELGQSFGNTDKAIAIPLHDSLKKGNGRPWVWADAGAQKEDEDEEAAENKVDATKKQQQQHGDEHGEARQQ